MNDNVETDLGFNYGIVTPEGTSWFTYEGLLFNMRINVGKQLLDALEEGEV